MIRSLAFIMTLALTACPSLEEEGPKVPTSSYVIAGTYDSSGAWDLSSPLTGDGVAGLVADMVVFKIVELAGVPEALQAEARERVAEVVYQPVRDNVRAALPAELLPESGLMGDLGQLLASVQTRGTLTLTPFFDNPNRFEGEDELSAISTALDGQEYAISIPDLLAGSGAVTIAGSSEVAVVASDTLTFEPYPLEIRLGGLVEILLREVLAIPDVAALTQQAAAAIDCANLRDTITNGTGAFEITVAGETFIVEATALEDGCQRVHDEVATYVLGLFSKDTGVSLEGGVLMSDSDGDQVVDGLTNAVNYRGSLTSLPLPIPVPFDASLSATR